jgi:hypothetical protein
VTHLLFRNKWIALIWAISVCLSIARFFGAGGGHEKLLVSKAQGRGEQVATQPHKNPWGIDKREAN